MSKASWQGRISTSALKVGDTTPVGAVCCGACRTCASTNVVVLGIAAAAGAVSGAVRLWRRIGPRRA